MHVEHMIVGESWNNDFEEDWKWRRGEWGWRWDVFEKGQKYFECAIGGRGLIGGWVAACWMYIFIFIMCWPNEKALHIILSEYITCLCCCCYGFSFHCNWLYYNASGCCCCYNNTLHICGKYASKLKARRQQKR